MQITFHGHACFELSDGDTRVLVDPFLQPNNPKAVASAEDVDPTHIAISHGHADHIADAAAVATRTGAQCVAVPEIVNWLGSQGVENSTDPNLGGTVEFDWGYISLVPAWHTNTTPDGTPVGVSTGLLVKIGETTAYHAGDTCLFGDMKLIAERSDVNVALLPIGGHYTMDRRDAVIAAQLVGAPTVIPMHYNTFPPIETDVEAFKSEVEQKTSSSVVILEPGESHSV
jgi:L-ascorbate metabolism protein UlaG (beta-lactamase superfamily)